MGSLFHSEWHAEPPHVAVFAIELNHLSEHHQCGAPWDEEDICSGLCLMMRCTSSRACRQGTSVRGVRTGNP
jgi:hypothetical protein